MITKDDIKKASEEQRGTLNLAAGLELTRVLVDSIESSKKDRKTLAGVIGVHQSMICKWQVFDTTTFPVARPNVDRIPAVMAAVENNVLIEHLCQFAGGFFIANPDSNINVADSLGGFSKVLQEFAGMAQEVAKAYEDGIIEKHEAEKIRQVWEQFKPSAESFVRNVELSCED